MKLKLREEPKEWLKFAAVIAVLPAAAAFGLYRKHHLSRAALFAVWTILVVALLVGALRTRWLRGFYRVGMTVSFRVGQFMGGCLLVVFFLLVLTPLAWLLRALGHDLLQLKRRRASTSTYWQASRPWGPFDRQF